MARFHDAPHVPAVDPVVELGERRRALVELACRAMPFDPPLSATHPLVVFCDRWNRAGGFRHRDRASLARLVEAAQRWVVELDLDGEFARIEERRALRRPQERTT